MNRLYAYDVLSVEDRVGITTLCMEYFWRLDFGHAETLTELFTDDAIWEGPSGTPFGGKYVGKAQLAEHWNARSQIPVATRHLMSNLRFVQDSPTTVRGWLSFTNYVALESEAKPAAPELVADYIDTYEKGADGKWRIKARKVEIVFFTEHDTLRTLNG